MFTAVKSRLVRLPFQLTFAALALTALPTAAQANEEEHLCKVTAAQADEYGAFIDFENGTELYVNRAGDPVVDRYYIASADWTGEPRDKDAKTVPQIFLGAGDNFGIYYMLMTQCTGKLGHDKDGIPILEINESSGAAANLRTENMALFSVANNSDVINVTINFSSEVRTQAALYAQLRNESETFRRDLVALAKRAREQDPKIVLPPLGGTGEGRMDGMTDQIIAVSFDYKENSNPERSVSGTVGWLWDRKTHELILDPQAIFTDRLASLQTQYCAALAEEWSKRGDGGASYRPDRGNGLYQGSWSCPSIGELQIILSGDGVFSQATLIANPLIAGPYAEGKFVVTLPLGPEEIANVIPEYRASFVDEKADN